MLLPFDLSLKFTFQFELSVIKKTAQLEPPRLEWQNVPCIIHFRLLGPFPLLNLNWQREMERK